MGNGVLRPWAVLFVFAVIDLMTIRAQPLMVWEQQRLLHFQSPAGLPSSPKMVGFQVTSPDVPLVVQSPDGFQLSANGIDFSRFAVYTIDQLRKGRQNLFVRFAPERLIDAVQDTLRLTGVQGVAGQAFHLHGSTLDPTQTLDMVNWNIQWFGSKTAGFGPVDDDLAQSNIRRIMDSLDADVYAFTEVVDTLRFSKLVASLPGYGYVLSPYCSGAAGNNSAAYAAGQKQAFVFRKSLFSYIKTRGLLRGSSTAHINWANGRFPFLVEAGLIAAGGAPWHFLVLHGKSGVTPADHEKRKAAVLELKDTLDMHFRDKALVLLGDFNDDLDTAIAGGIHSNASSYFPLVADSTAAHHYHAVSTLLSKTGSRTMAAYADPVDHVVISDELRHVYLKGSVRVVYEVGKWVKNYTTTTSDHYPVISRFKLQSGTITSVSNPVAAPAVKVMKAGHLLILKAPMQAGSVAIAAYNLQGELLYAKDKIPVRAGLLHHQIDVSRWIPGTYLLRVTTMGKTIALRIFIHP
jgi:endonuclease/exonuclease/phosphatase family metal-dependent hydrolase